MFKIGDFSRLTRVSVKTLRYYDTIGLLKPAHIDRFTGYRYYAGEQLPRLNRILALKDLGLSLDQIADMLRAELPAAEIRGMLTLKQAEVQQTVSAEQARLNRLETRLRQIEGEGMVPRYEIIVKQVDRQTVASVRDHLSAFSDIGRLFDELRAYQERTTTEASAWTAIWHELPAEDAEIDGEATFTTNAVLADDEVVRESELPAATLACAAHHGPFLTIGDAYAALFDWLERHDSRLAGPIRELYLRAGNQQDNPHYVTEVQFPV